jgi:predicted nucleic acid-binding protein
LVLTCFQDHTVVASEYILAEVAEHYVGKFKATVEQANIAVETLRANCEMVQPVTLPPDSCDDADDVPVLGTAVAGRVAYLVTGDRALQGLSQFQDIEIVSPRQLYEKLRAVE